MIFMHSAVPEIRLGEYSAYGQSLINSTKQSFEDMRSQAGASERVGIARVRQSVVVHSVLDPNSHLLSAGLETDRLALSLKLFVILAVDRDRLDRPFVGMAEAQNDPFRPTRGWRIDKRLDESIISWRVEFVSSATETYRRVLAADRHTVFQPVTCHERGQHPGSLLRGGVEQTIDHQMVSRRILAPGSAAVLAGKRTHRPRRR